jgi:hypothetical protein
VVKALKSLNSKSSLGLARAKGSLPSSSMRNHLCQLHDNGMFASATRQAEKISFISHNPL